MFRLRYGPPSKTLKDVYFIFYTKTMDSVEGMHRVPPQTLNILIVIHLLATCTGVVPKNIKNSRINESNYLFVP